jgi:NAD dependent epimerase/dehydratase
VSLEGSRVLVTGAAGFIGSHLTEALVRAGARVTALTHYSSREDDANLDAIAPDLRTGIELIRGDILDPHALRRASRGRDTIFHLAAQIAIPYSYQSPQIFLETNALGTLHVLEAALANDVARVLHTSTSEVYGTAQYTPIDERHPLQAQSPYAASKIAADKIAESFHRSFGVPVVTVRPFNTFGPRQSSRAIIPTIMGQLASGAPRLRLGALDPIRDLNFVTDTVAGFVHLAQADGVVGQEFNVGSGVGVSIGELAQRIMAIAGCEVPIDCEAPRMRPEKSEVMELRCDSARIRATGWRPQVALDEGLRRTWQTIANSATALRTGAFRA